MAENSSQDVRFAHANLVADDWKALAKFYQDVFGCRPLGPERDHRGPHVEALTRIQGAGIRGQHLLLPGFGDNGPTLEVFQYDKNEARLATAANRPGFAHIAFQVADVEKKRQEVLDQGGSDLGRLQVG